MSESTKTVLLTGGTGSFGSGFIAKLLSQPEVAMVRCFSRDEHKQRKLRAIYQSDRVSFYIGDVRDKDRLRRAMEDCHWVVHAAALKQAPLGEIEGQEFIKTNVLGTMNIVEAAADTNPEKVILVSTDKAVEPINLYGATKMCAERLVLQADLMRGLKKTRYAVVRYGNVVGTAGSIVQIYKDLPDDAPTPVYDHEATRFWLTLEEAHEIVIKALREPNGGFTLIPDIPSVRVVDVAKAMRPYNEIRILGPREGDKRHEVLLIGPKRLSSDNNRFLSVDEIRESIAQAIS